MADMECRMAKAEQRVETLYHSFSNHVKEERVNTAEIMEAISEIREYQRQQKGFIAGVTFTVTAVIAVAGAAANWIFNK